LSCKTTHGKQRLSSRCVSSLSSDHTRRKSAAFQRRASLAPLSIPLQDGFCFLLRPLPAPPFPLLALGRLQGLTLCTALERESGLPRSARFTNKSGEDASVPREGQRVRRCAVKSYRPALHALLALGPYGGSRPARVTYKDIRLLSVGSSGLIMIEASSSPYPSGLRSVGKSHSRKRRSPQAILHHPASILLWERRPCPQHGRLCLASRGGNLPAPEHASRLNPRPQDPCPLLRG
jgi:hypothetical protein